MKRFAIQIIKAFKTNAPQAGRKARIRNAADTAGILTEITDRFA